MITEVDLDGTPCFATNARLSGLKAVNFIFGPNGSGKTTLTRRLGNKDTNGNKSAHVYNHDYVKISSSLNLQEQKVNYQESRSH